MAPWPVHSLSEVAAVTRVLQSGCTNQWTGSEIAEFEVSFAEWLGVKQAIAVSSGTTALLGALHGLGIGPGMDVIVPARSFVAAASTPIQLGARPVFADVDVQSGNVTVETLAAARTESSKCVIVVHLDGWPCDMIGIRRWANRHGLFVVEDCAQAQGAEINGVRVGCFGHAATFSFCQDKIMSTGGEGGMVVTGDSGVASRVLSWRDHGRTFVEPSQTRGRGFKWQIVELGGNYRMTGMQAAIGLVQLGLVDDWLDKRRRNAQLLRDEFQDQSGIACFMPPADVRHAYYRLTCHLPSSDRDGVLEQLSCEGWPVRSGPCPELYRERLLREFGPQQRLRSAAFLAGVSLSLPVHPTASIGQMQSLAKATCHAAVQVESENATFRSGQ